MIWFCIWSSLFLLLAFFSSKICTFTFFNLNFYSTSFLTFTLLGFPLFFNSVFDLVKIFVPSKILWHLLYDSLMFMLAPDNLVRNVLFEETLLEMWQSHILFFGQQCWYNLTKLAHMHIWRINWMRKNPIISSTKTQECGKQ